MGPTPATCPPTRGHGMGLRESCSTHRLGTDSGLLPWPGQTRQVVLPDKGENTQVTGNFRQRVIFSSSFTILGMYYKSAIFGTYLY